MNTISRLLISFGAVAVTAAASSYFTLSGITGWYGMAEKAPLTPPSEWFRIIWGILYLLMAFSYYLVLGKPRTAKTLEAGRLFFSQLLFQMVWCFCFFYLGYTGAGIAVLLFLAWTVRRMIGSFAQIDKFAAALNYPYFIWLLFALWLNISFVWLNGASIEI